MIFAVLGVLSAVVFIACDIPYLIDAIKAKIKPHRVTWGVVVILNAAGFANQWASGADNSLWLFGAGVLMTGAIFLASLKNGVGGHTKSDIISLIACFVGVGLWLILGSPLFSIFANIAVSFIATLPTFKKARRAPKTETRIAWLGGTISAFLSAVSVGELNVQLLLLPVASVIMQGYMVYLLYSVAGRNPAHSRDESSS